MTSGFSAERVAFWGKRAGWGLGLAVSVLVALFIGVLMAEPDKLFADDSYFYFQVAWNFARGMGSTFNNIMPTNGYHPLWMLICAAVFKVVPSKLGGVRVIGAVIALLDLLTLWTVKRLLVRVAEDLWPIAFVLLIPFCFLSQLGTEGALSGMFLALLMLVGYGMAEAPSPRAAALFNLVAATAVLSRLDNIFIVAFVWLAVWNALGGPVRPGSGRWLQIVMLPVYAVLWGGYIASNWIYFHTVQPISGLLKSNGRLDHKLGGNLPHTAWFALAIIVVCLAIVAMRKRDLFFRTIEVPFALGVFCHAAYITLRMTGETRWSWYYTSWILLASVLLARAAGIVLEERRRLALPVAALCVVVIAGAWVKEGYHKFYLGADPRPPASFNETVYGKEGIRNVLAYDQPGSLAFYSNVHIVPLDGLMGDINFQHDLATKGLAAVMAEEHIDGFIGPSEAMKAAQVHDMCEQVYLSTEQFHCVADGKGTWQPVGVDVYARVPFVLSGTLTLDKDKVVWNKKDFVAVWRVGPDAVK